jgi:hypothetical protein
MHRAIHDWIGILMTHFSTASRRTWIRTGHAMRVWAFWRANFVRIRFGAQ